MNTPHVDLECIADEFLTRMRTGETPSIQQYAKRYPEQAAEIAEMLTSIEMLEQLSQRETELRQQANTQPQVASLAVDRLSEFDLIREIGRGGMGVVYEAIDRTLDRRVALKVLNDSALATSKHVDRFRRESRLAAKLHHTNIVSVFGVGSENGTHFYAMQYVDGVSLQDVLHGLRVTESNAKVDGTLYDSATAINVANALLHGEFAQSRNTPLAPNDTADPATADTSTERSDPAFEQTVELSNPRDGSDDLKVVTTNASSENPPVKSTPRFGNTYWRSIARIGVQVAEALNYAHTNGILHRDIKPANLLFDSNGTVWVADFGLAKLADHDDLTQTGDVVGTLRYMAPEQLSGQSYARTDIHALGQTLYELLTLRPLCTGETYREIFAQKQQPTHASPRKLNPSVPRDLSTIVQKATDHEPSKRYASAKSLAEDLQNFLDDRPILARRVTWTEQAWRWCRRNRALAATATISSALLVLLPIVLGWAYVREAKQKVQTERTLNVALNGFDELFRSFFDNESATVSALSESGGADSLTSAMVTKDTARVLERMLVFYDRLAEANESSGNAQLNVESAKARRRVGDLYQRLGQFTKATQAYDEASERYVALAKRDANHRIEIGRIHQAKGAIYSQQQDQAAAMKEYRRAMDVFLSLSVNDQSKYEVARTHYLLSTQPSVEGRSGDLGQGRRRPFPRRQREGRRDWEHFGSPAGFGPDDHGPPQPGPEDGGRDDSEPERSEADNQRASQLATAIALVGELLDDDPESPAYRLLLALCLRDSDTEQLFDPDSTSPRARAATLLRELADQFPANPRYRFELSETYRVFGNGVALEETAKRQIEQLLVARELSEQLVEEQPDVASYRIHLAHIHAHLGAEYGRLGMIQQAEASTLRSIAAHESVARDFPGLAGLSTRLSTHDKMRLATWYAALQRWEELVELIRPLGESLAMTVDEDAWDEAQDDEMGSMLGSCRELLLQAYDELQDDEGYLIAFSWPIGPQGSQPDGPGFGGEEGPGRPPRRGRARGPGSEAGPQMNGPEFRVVDQALSYDTNLDAILTRDEVPSRMAKEWFEQADQNNDGRVERREIRRMLAPRP